MSRVKEYHPLLKIDAPDWYKDPQFVDWLNGKRGTAPATWHTPGGEPGEYSDVFVHYADGDGSDAPTGDGTGIPEHIWEQIKAELHDEFMEDLEVLLWIRNIQ